MPADDDTRQLADLRAVIEGEIRAAGSIPFSRFMELALYAPNLGYYEREPRRVGRHGDYYTSVSVGPVFGELIAFQIAEWLEELESGPAAGDGEGRQLVEAGAHDARLALDILCWLRQWRPQCFERIEYWILEPSIRRREWQRERLAEFAGKVRWMDGWRERPGPWITGVCFSNELLDAFPVRRLGWDATGRSWYEWGVGSANGEFRWVKRQLGPGCEPAFAPAPPAAGLLGVLPDGFTTELCPAGIAWWREAATALKRGRLLTFDYGLEAEDFFVPQRPRGTLRGYREHRPVDDLLAGVGEQDLTAHVNFSALRDVGESVGLKTDALESQRTFLTAVFGKTIAAQATSGAWTPERRRQFQTLTHPDHLGRSFRVLVQSR